MPQNPGWYLNKKVNELLSSLWSMYTEKLVKYTALGSVRF